MTFQTPVEKSSTLPHTPEDFNRMAAYLLRREMTRRGVTFRELARRLTAQGYEDTARSLGMRINRGTFTVSFLLRVLQVLDVKRLDWEQVPPAWKPD